MKVWVTRPQGQQQALTQALGLKGWKVVAEPLLQIDPLIESSPEALQANHAIQNLNDFDVIIMVSLNAVKFGLEKIDAYWPQLPVGICWMAVGDATAKALSTVVEGVISPQAAMDSDGLLALPPLLQVANKKIAIFRGVGGRPQLEKVLTERGARVTLVELYRRELPTPVNVPNIKDIDVIAVASGETLNNLLAVIKGLGCEQGVKSTGIIVPSQRVGDLAKQEGFQEVIIAPNATVTATVEALECWRKEKTNNLGGNR